MRATRRARRLTLLDGRWLLSLPLVLASLALLALLGTTQQDSTDRAARTVPLRVVHDPQGQLDVVSAQRRASETAAQERISNKRLYGPFWIQVDLPLPSRGLESPRVLLLGDRHIVSADIYVLSLRGDVISHGQARREPGVEAGGGAIERTSTGFVIRLDETAEPAMRVVAKVTTLGAAMFAASVDDAHRAQVAGRLAERAAGLLAGAFCMLALFAAVVAWLSRLRLFALFVPWLVCAFLMAAITLGHDYTLIGGWPSDWLETRGKQLIISSYVLASLALFWALFRKPLSLVGWAKPVRLMQRGAIAMCALGLLLPPFWYLPLYHGFAAMVLVAMIAAQYRLLQHRRTPQMLWYAGAWLAQGVTGAAELAYTLGIITPIPGLSVETGAVVGAVLTGAALADTLGHERRRRRVAQLRAEESARHYRRIYDAAPGGMLRLSEAGVVLHINRLACDWLGVDATAVGQPAAHLFGAASATALLAAVRADGRASLELDRPAKLDAAVGAEAVGPEALHRTLALQATLEGREIEVVLADVSGRAELAATLGRMAVRDALTGLFNRHGLEAGFEALAERVAQDQPACVMHLDLDRFKLVNDVFGHATGDALLKAVAARLQAAAPADATLARLGGDEFLLLLPGVDGGSARTLAARLLAALSDTPHDVGRTALAVSACAGVVQVTPAMSAKDVLACADRACRDAKRRGRGLLAVYSTDDGSLAAYQEDTRLADSLRSRAILSQLELHAQPIVALDRAGRGGLEVLLRVRGADGGAAAPGRLISVAERAGEMPTIDRFVLSSTLRYLAENPGHAGQLEFMAVNLSGASLNDERFIADACAMLGDDRDAAGRICLEITESVALQDLQATRRFVDTMRSLGVRIALDDFGAGYTSFSYLADLQAQFVKIDGGFVRDMLAKPSRGAIMETLVELTHRLGMQAIAEWIEDAPTLEALQALRCDYGQGYFFAGAAPLAEWAARPLPRVLTAASRRSAAPSRVLALPTRGRDSTGMTG